MKNEKPETDEELAATMRGLVKWILCMCENPNAWPLCDADRILFLRSCYHQSKNISDSEPFARAELLKAAEDVAKFNATQARLTRQKVNTNFYGYHHQNGLRRVRR